MNKEEFRSFLNVPDKIPHNYKTKLTQDLVLVPLFYTPGLETFGAYVRDLMNVIASPELSFAKSSDLLQISQLIREAFDSQLNGRVVNSKLIPIAFDVKHPLHSTLTSLLTTFHSKEAVDYFLDNWWDHKKNFVTLLSTYDGWSDKNFALKVSGSSSNGIDYPVGTRLFSNMLQTSYYSRGFYKRRYDVNNNVNGVIDSLRYAISEVYRIVVLDNTKIPMNRNWYESINFNSLSGDTLSYKSFLTIQKHLEDYPVTSNVDGNFVDTFANTYGYRFKDLMSLIYYEIILERFTRINIESTFYGPNLDWSERQHATNIFINHLISSLFMTLRCNKQGINKQVVVKKLLRMLGELSVMSTSRLYDYLADDADFNPNRPTFEQLTQLFDTTLAYNTVMDGALNHDKTTIYTTIQFKVRNQVGGGFNQTNNPSYQQIFQKIIECFVSKTVEQSFVINLHPVAQLFSSYMDGYTSCHNMVNISPDKSSASLGMYHYGQFQTAQSGGFVLSQYNDYPEDHLCFEKMTYRAQMFITPELDLIRQHLAYPGRNNDEASRAEAKTYRTIIHELLTPWHGVGTSGWFASKNGESSSELNMRGFNFNRARLNSRGDTLKEVALRSNGTDSEEYLGYQSEMTFAYSHIMYDNPKDFKLVVGIEHRRLTDFSYRIRREDNFYSYNVSRTKLLPPSYEGGLTWDTKYSHHTWEPISNFIKVQDRNNIFKLSPSTPHGTCQKCSKHFLDSSVTVCDKCLAQSTSTLFSSMVKLTEHPIYFKHTSQDDLAKFLTNVASNSNIVWKNNDSLTSFIPQGPSFLLVLKDGKLSVKVTQPKDSDSIIDVSAVVFE
jgi:hypothetical protein